MKTLILAAGEGTRLRPLTNNIPKAMVPICGDPVMLRQLEILQENGIEDVSVVGGYCQESFPEDRVKVISNPDYAQTNMVYSMFQAEEVFNSNQEVLIVYGDILFGTSATKAIINQPGDIVVGVNTEWQKLWEARFEDPLSDAESMILDGNKILELGKTVNSMDEIQGQFTGLIKFSAVAAKEIWLEWGKDALNHPESSSVSNLYMTDFLQCLIDKGNMVSVSFVDGDWLEVDSVGDLELYERLAQAGQLSNICSFSSDFLIKELNVTIRD